MGHWKLLKALGIAGVAALLTGGCASTYTFKVDAINNPEVEELYSYKIVSTNPEVSEEDLEFKEAAEYIKTVLSAKGMYEAPDVEHADMIIDLSYGVGEPQVEYRKYYELVYATTTDRYSTVATPVIKGKGNKANRVIKANRAKAIRVNKTKRASRVNERNRVELVGLEEKVVPITVYEKHLRLTSRDNTQTDESEAPVQAWSIYVMNKDQSDDIRKYLPLMAAAAIEYVGENTETQQKIKVKEDDEKVSFVKAGL